MTTLRLSPGSVDGRVPAPPSKSYTHRALLVGLLAPGRYRLENPLRSRDTVATARGLVALGARVETGLRSWTVFPGRGPRRRRAVVRCGASGTTFRFLTALAARGAGPVRFVGDARLARRPIAELVDALARRGVVVRRPPHRAVPLEVEGPARPGRFWVDGSRSSQFVSALLMLLPGLEGPSTLRWTGRRVSRPYVAATVALLRAHGIALGGAEPRWTVPAPQRATRDRFRVPGDASSAAYLWAAAAVTGGRVTVTGISRRWPQADLVVLETLEAMGATVRETARGVAVEGPVRRGVAADLTDAPDLFPLVAAVAATIPDRSLLRGAPQLVHKETDRGATTQRLLRLLGARVRPTLRGVEIEGRSPTRRLTRARFGDHRLVMSAAVGALAADGPSTFGDPSTVAKSFPEFWSRLRDVGAEVAAA